MEKRKQIEEQLKEARQGEARTRKKLMNATSPFCCDNRDCDCSSCMEPSEAAALSYFSLEDDVLYWEVEISALEEQLSKLPALQS